MDCLQHVLYADPDRLERRRIARYILGPVKSARRQLPAARRTAN
jgi:hypothetical protein